MLIVRVLLGCLTWLCIHIRFVGAVLLVLILPVSILVSIILLVLLAASVIEHWAVSTISMGHLSLGHLIHVVLAVLRILLIVATIAIGVGTMSILSARVL